MTMNQRAGRTMRGLAVILVIAAACAWFWLLAAGKQEQAPPDQVTVLKHLHTSPTPASDDVTIPSSATVLRETAEPGDESPLVDGIAVFSGWIVDTLGNPVANLLVKAYLLHEIVAGNRSSEHACSTEDDGSFRIELPASWDQVPLGVAVTSYDHSVSALLVARARAGQTLVVRGLSDPADRLSGIVRIRGPLTQGHWLMPIERARALVAGGQFEGAIVKLGEVTLNLERHAWEDGALGLALLSRSRSPVAYRRFDDAVALSDWLATAPEIVVSQCQVNVPPAEGHEVSQIEFGLSQVPQFGVVWWGKAEVADHHVELCAESGTSFAVLGTSADGSHRSIGRCTVERSRETAIDWQMTLPGLHDVRIPINLSLANGVRRVDVQAVPILDDGVRVLARRAWPTARGLVGNEPTDELVVEIKGLADGRYELQVVVGRRVVASVETLVPGDVPTIMIPGQTSVVFEIESQLAGQSAAQVDVCYMPEGGVGAPTAVRLPTGIGGFEGFSLQNVQPGAYRYCLRYGDKYSEGWFTVESGSQVVRVPVVEESIKWIDGVIEADGERGPCIVAVHMPHLAAPWLSVESDESGAFRLGVPIRYLDRGLSAQWASGTGWGVNSIPGKKAGVGRGVARTP